MRSTIIKRWTLVGVLSLVLLLPGLAAAQGAFGRIVVFGDSLSDPGNFFTLSGVESTPPYGTLDFLLIPDAPYAKGGHHFSNGATWVEQYARPLGLAGNTRPAFQAPNTGATNYAIGGARARLDKTKINLSEQVNVFLGDFNFAAPSDALYVVEFGGNDIRDAFEVFASGADGSFILKEALGAISDNVVDLYKHGATKFLVWNAPNLALTPAIRTLDGIKPGAAGLAEKLTIAFNDGLDFVLTQLAGGLPGIKIVKFDVNKKINDIVLDPKSFGLTEVEKACVTPNTPPYDCQTPDEFLFWDGIHPTKTVHDIIAQEAAYALGQK